MSRKNGQKALKDTLNDYQRGRRATRIMARQTIAEQLVAFTYYNTEPMRRGFFGRLWWILRGLPVPKAPVDRQETYRNARRAQQGVR